MSKLSDKLKEEGKERLEDLKDGADEWKDDVVNFWNIDKKALLITIVVCLAIGFVAGAIIF